MLNNGVAAIGIAGEIKGKTKAGAELARLGMAGANTKTLIAAGVSANSDPQARFGMAGLSTRGNIRAACGVAGLDHSGVKATQEVTNIQAFQQRDAALSQLVGDKNRLGDRAAREAWGKGVWFSDFTYACTPFHQTDNGGYVPGDGIRWRDGRSDIFCRENRTIPFLIDSAGYRRELTGTAPQWARDEAIYPSVIELLDPDGYAAWDYPQDRGRTLTALHDLMRIFPDDVTNGRMWPVFSIRWVLEEKAHLGFTKLPGWSSRPLANLIPQNRTQRQFKDDTREGWARQAIANALVMAADPDFRWMCDTFGKVMIGGMVKCSVNRAARHLIAAVLATLFPGVQFWMLGQANFAVINGLGMMELLERIWTDGSWWIQDATAERFAVVENSLITMMELSVGRKFERQSFFTTVEMMAANLRSLLAAYQGLWSWPPPEPLPLDLLDIDQAREMKVRLKVAQMELGL